MKNNFDILEFDVIKKNIKQYSFSSMARMQIDGLAPIQDLEDLKLFQDDIDQATKMIYAYGRLPISPFEDITEILQKANKGGVLFPQDFLLIIKLLKNIKEIDSYLDNDIPISHIYDYMSMLYLPKDLLQAIERCIDPSGHIYDHASYELQRIRRRIVSIEASIRKKIESIKVAHKDHLSHDVISSRNDHLVLPVKISYKNQMRGISHGQSSSGATIFIEPEEIVAYNGQLATAKEEEQQEIHRILLELTHQVKNYYRTLTEDLHIMIDVDMIFSIATYSKALDMVIPDIVEKGNELSLIKARHPLIDRDHVVANDIVLQRPKDILLISGSNTGGKTVALKTVGLLSLMAVCGLPIPVKEAKLPLFDEIYVDLGDEQSIEQSLSTFSSHMSRLVSITQHCTDKSLVIIDEICSGTDPKEGESLAQAILTYLHQRGCLTFASTHYSALKQYAKETDYIQIASVEFDQEKMVPTYHLIQGSVGNSYAIEISKHLGLNEDIIQNAYTIKNNSLSVSEKLLEQLQNEMQSVLQEKEKLLQMQHDADEKEKKYHSYIDKYLQQKDKLLEEAKEEANLYLEEAKEKTNVIFKQLQGQIKPHVAIQAKKELEEAKYQKKQQKIVDNHVFQAGDIVKVLSVNREGEVIDVNKKGILTIYMGGIKLNAKTSEVQFLHQKREVKKETSNARALRKTTKQSFELNIIGLRYEEAMREVDKFIDNALVNNYSMVRIIHGMGTGVLRNGVRKMLDKNKYVKSYRDGGPNEGGLGATLVYFE